MQALQVNVMIGESVRDRYLDDPEAEVVDMDAGAGAAEDGAEHEEI